MATWVVVESTDDVLRIAPNANSGTEDRAPDQTPGRVELVDLATHQPYATYEPTAPA